jgi:hypothetical protein
MLIKESLLFVVAIDFGTTYSGYAFSNIHRKDEIFTHNWIEGISQAPKTPTSILFTPLECFAAFGYEAEGIAVPSNYLHLMNLIMH